MYSAEGHLQLHGNILLNNADVTLIPADGHIQVQSNTPQQLVPDEAHGCIILNNADVTLIPADRHIQAQCNISQKLVPMVISNIASNVSVHSD